MTLTRDAMLRAGILMPQLPTKAEREHREAREAKLATRGKPHDLTADEVAAAERLGVPLARYADLKTVRNLDDYQAVRRRASVWAQAEREAELEQARRALRG